MILAENPSIENVKHQRELIAHIQPADDELLAEEALVEVITDDEEEAETEEDES